MLSVRRAICEAGGGGRSYQISIHALREEGDLLIITTQGCKGRISIHALREEGDNLSPRFGSVEVNFYPRPPRGGRLWSF